MNKIRQISKREGKPFDELVKQHAKEGKSRLVTAGLLGIDYTHFLHVLRQRELFDEFQPQQIRIGNTHPTRRWPKGMPRINLRAPITHNGSTWYPGEPTHHYLYEKGVRSWRKTNRSMQSVDSKNKC